VVTGERIPREAGRRLEWARSFASLGLNHRAAVSGMTEEDKTRAYECDVTYATNNELGLIISANNMKSELRPEFFRSSTTLPSWMRSTVF